MPSSRYALVTYVRNPVGEFVTQLRRELHPTLPHMPAHLTILPPGNSSEASRPRWNFWKKRAATPSLSASNWETWTPFCPRRPPCSSRCDERPIACANCTIDSAVRGCAAEKIGPTFRISPF